MLWPLTLAGRAAVAARRGRSATPCLVALFAGLAVGAPLTALWWSNDAAYFVSWARFGGDRRRRCPRRGPGGGGRRHGGGARRLVALHATDPSTVHLSRRRRGRGPRPTSLPPSDALYDDRTLTRLLGMRRTMWVVPTAVVPVVQSASTAEVEARERKRLVQAIEQAGAGRPTALRLARRGRGGDASPLSPTARRRPGGRRSARRCRRSAQRCCSAATSKWAVEQNLTTRVLLLLGATRCRSSAAGPPARGRRAATRGCRRRRGSDRPRARPPVDRPTARVELARRWLGRLRAGDGRGSALVGGVDARGDRQALRRRRRRGGRARRRRHRHRARRTTSTPSPPVEPWVALLPALDPTAMGWK